MAGPLAAREMRCLAMTRGVVFGLGRGNTSTIVWRWVTANGWSPIPDQWFGSPEEASERFREAAEDDQPALAAPAPPRRTR